MTDKATDNDYYVIDLLYLAKCVWHRAWIVVLATIAAAAIGFAYSAFIIQPSTTAPLLKRSLKGLRCPIHMRNSVR